MKKLALINGKVYVERGDFRQAVYAEDGVIKAVGTNDEILALAGSDAKLEKLFEMPWLIKTPVVRNGKQATVGYCPDVWKTWE